MMQPIDQLVQPDNPSEEVIRPFSNPFETNFTSWEEQVAAQDRAMSEWRTKAIDSVDQSILDWDNFSKGKTIDLSFAPDPETARKRGIIGNYLAIANNGQPIGGGNMGPDVYRDQLAVERFGGRGVGDEMAFYSEIEKEAKERKSTREINSQLASEASKSALVGMIDGSAKATSFTQWRQEAMKSPGYKPGMEFAYAEIWNESEAAIRDRLTEFKEPLSKVWAAMGSSDLGRITANAYYQTSEDQREAFMDSLGLLAQTLPAEQQQGFWNNLGKQTGRDFESLGGQAIEAIKEFSISSTVGFSGSESLIAQGKMERAERNFRADVGRIRDSKFDPVKTLAKEGSTLAFVESGIYGAPGVIASPLMMAVPVVGTSLMYSSMTGSAYESTRFALLDSGLSDEQASNMASEWAPAIAAIQFIPERIGFGVITRKLPVFERAMKSVSDRVANRFVRGAVSAGAIGAAETITENIQDLVPSLVQETVGALQQDVPEVDWEKQFEGYSGKTLSTFVATLPLAIFGAAGGLNREARARAFADATPLQRRAFGITDADSAAIDEAAARGQGSLNAAIDQAMENRLPESEQTLAAATELEAQILAQNAAAEELKASNMIPDLRRLTDGSWIVSDQETGQEVGRAATTSEAFQLAQSHSSAMDERSAETASLDAQELLAQEEAGWRKDVVATTMEAADLVAEQMGSENSETDLKLGAVVTTQTAEQPVNTERISRQLELEDIAGGGNGDIVRAVWGQSVTETNEDARKTINRIFAGGSIMTVFHEKGHEVRRKAYANGSMTREAEIALYRNLDTIWGGKTEKRTGQQLRFIPDDISDSDISDELLDEAFSQLLESEVIRSGRDSKSQIKVPRAVFSRNVTALAKLMSPDNARTWTSFMKAIRHYWGLVFSRAKALDKAFRDGTIDRASYDEFLGKMLGLSEQDAHNAKAAETTKSITESSSFSLGPADESSRPAVNLAEAKEAAKSFIGQPITNKDDGLVASVSGNNLRKMTSSSAVNSSVSPEDHAFAVANLDSLFESAVRTHSGPDRAGSVNIKAMHRYYSPFMHGREVMLAKMTVKEMAAATDGNKIYSVQTLDVAKPATNAVSSISEDRQNYIALAGFEEKLQQRIDEVKKADDTAFSLGPAAMSDALAGEAISRIRNPKQKAKAMQGIAEKMSDLKRDKDELGIAFGKGFRRKAIEEPRGIADIRKEASLRREAKSDLVDETMANASLQDRNEAKRKARNEVDRWEKTRIAEEKANYAPKARLLRSLAMLDGIIASLPIDLRGRIGGHTQLAKLGTDEKRLEFLTARIAKADDVIEAWLKKEYDRMYDRLLDKAKPAKDEAGKKRVGKAGADIHSLFDVLREAREWNETKTEAHAAALEAEISKGEMTPEDEAHATLEANLVRLTGDWKNADAARRASAVENATRVFETGYAKFRLAKLFQREDREIARKALRADTGKVGTLPERKSKELSDNKLAGGWKDVVLGLVSFDQVLGLVFGDKSAAALRLADMERQASNKKEDAIQNAVKGIEDLFTGLAGDQYAGEQLRWKMSQPSMKVGNLNLSEFEALTATLMWRQEDGRRHMIGHKDGDGNPAGEWNYDQAFIDEIEGKLSPEALAVRAHLMTAYAGEYDRLNPIYRELNGINLPKNQNYAPITVKPQQAAGGQSIDPVTGSSFSGASLTPGSLRTRGGGIAEPDFKDALQVFLGHTKQMEHWMAYAEFTGEAMALLNNREVGNSIEAKSGKQAVSVLRSWLDHFAQGGNRDAAAHLALNQKLQRMAGRAASAALIGRASVLAIQSTQLGAAWAEMPTASYLKRFAKLTTGQLGWVKAIESEYIQRRMQQMPPVVRQAMEGLKATKPNLIKHAVQKLGTLIGGADALFTAGTFAMVHDYQLGQAKEMGLTGQEAEAWALNAAERATDRVAQPTRPGARSLFENTQTSPFAKLAWSFASEPRQKLALSAYALAAKPLPEKMRALAVTWIIGGMVATVIRAASKDIRDDGDDDEIFDEKNWGVKRLILSTLTGPAAGLPVIGDLLEGAAYKATGEYLPEGNLFSAIPNAAKAIMNIPDWLDEEPDRIIKDVETILTGLGLGNDTIAAAASLSHLARDLFGVSSNVLPD